MKTIHTDNAPKAVGPYSQAIISGGFVFTAGQIALNPETGEMVGDNIAIQTEQVMKNISAILRFAGTNFANVIKCDVYLTDLLNFSEFNNIYGKYFDKNYPARVTVEVNTLPKNALIEISAIAELN
ncbi:RidA family protein [bacterium]|nr:RidA family protein [bacterium]